MKAFVVHLQDATQYERIADVTSFVGQDASGSFGLMAGHARMVTVLAFGLARFRIGEQAWQYVAVPEAVLYFLENELWISTRRYLRDDDFDRISLRLDQELRVEEANLSTIKEGVRRLQEELFRRLWQMGRHREWI
jgi:F-type H+-transporting ATPase subunit epsilon